MNMPQTTSQERVERLIARTLLEAKRKNKGPIYHLFARLQELDSETERYKRIQINRDVLTLDHASGMRAALAFGIGLVMKYRHRTPGIIRDEIDLALRGLIKARAFEKLEPLSIAA
jgi:hypothetical protein